MDESPSNPPKQNPEETSPSDPNNETLPATSEDEYEPKTSVTQKFNSTGAFVPDETVAGRFRIVRFIAQGGMGEVYEAEDLELKQRVALKTVRFSHSDESRAIERFRQEIIVAKRITHPNICRTFDLFRHSAKVPGEPDILVVSMELLAGKTLEQCLKEKGRYNATEALPLVKQMVAGLRAAHQAGVVHRDFKTSNVMLVPGHQGSDTVRAVISDFGLAHSMHAGEFSLTGAGDIVGTPAYMAPEQVESKEITPATDIYSLGVVMFQMVTGKLPFVADTAMATAVKRLQEPPPSPKSFQPDLDETWSVVILKCLEREPRDRFAMVEGVERALEGEEKPTLRSETETKQRKLSGAMIGVGLAAIAALGILIGIKYPNLFSTRKGPSVAVMGFRNMTGDTSLDRWGEEFKTNLGTELEVKPIRLMTQAKLAHSWKAPPPSEMPEEPPPEVLNTLKENGCDYVVTGTYTVVGNPGSRIILWNVRLIKVDTGESLESFPKKLSETQLLDVIPEAGWKLRNSLGVTLTATDKKRVDGSLPANDKASEAYAAGLRKLQNFEYAQAKDLFLTATEADPSNAEMRGALAGTWWALGYEEKALVEAQQATQQSRGLTAEKTGLIQARYLGYAKQWDEAAAKYAALWNLSSEEPMLGLLQADAQFEGKHYNEALVTLRKIQGKDVPKLVQVERDLQMAQVQEKLGDNGERLKAAMAAATQAKSLGAEMLQARAEIEQCLAMMAVGKMNEATAVCADAVDLSRKQGDDLATARAKNAVANGYRESGRADEAKDLYQQAWALSSRIGDKRDEAGALLNLGNIEFDKNNFPEARVWYEKSIKVSVERGGTNDDLLLAKQSVAAILSVLGDTRAEITLLKELQSDAEKVDDKDMRGTALTNLCGALLVTGEVLEARKDCEIALQLRREMKNRSEQAESLAILGDVQMAMDEIPPSVKNYQESLKIREELGEPARIATTRVSLAGAEIEKGAFPDAIESASKALRQFLESKDTDGEAMARTTLSDAYLRSGRLKESPDEIAKAKTASDKSSDPNLKATVAIQEARVGLRTGTTPPTVRLKAFEKELLKKGLLQTAIDARLALAQCRSFPNRKERESELGAVETEAMNHGYALLARKAREARAATLH